MIKFKDYLSEAKFDNNLDLEEVLLVAKQNEVALRTNVPEQVEEALTYFRTQQVSMVNIFSKSIAFRVGRGSVKSITGFGNGFKATLKGGASDLLDIEKSLGKSKVSIVMRFALLAILEDEERVSTEEDKTEAAETAETLETIKKLNDIIGMDGYINIKLGNTVVPVDGFRQISGRPKADMAFTYQGKDVIFVSHKLGKSPGNFQQYGGITDLGLNNNSRVSSKLTSGANKILQEFFGNIDLILEHVLGLSRNDNNLFDFKETAKGTNFAYPIENDEIAGLVMFGVDYGKAFGLNNCHILLDGNILFNKINDETNTYELDATFHSMLNPKIPGANTKFPRKGSVYQPAMLVTRSGPQGLKQGGFDSARFVIWPSNSIVKRYHRNYLLNLKKAKRIERKKQRGA